MNPEAKLELYLRSKVRELGGMVLKLMPVIAGTPDDLVILPGGRLFLVELKVPKGILRPVQVVMHQRLRAMGVPVAVLKGQPEIDRWLDTLDASLYPMRSRISR